MPGRACRQKRPMICRAFDGPQHFVIGGRSERLVITGSQRSQHLEQRGSVLRCRWRLFRLLGVERQSEILGQ